MNLLDIGCAFDWITPSIAFIQDFANGPVAHFGIPAETTWGQGDIRRLLQSRSIRVWGLMYNLSGDMLMFTVPQIQARWAYYLLQREGVPVLYVPKEAIPKETASPDSIFKQLDDVPQTTLGNNSQMADMTIVTAPSVWGLIGKAIAGLF